MASFIEKLKKRKEAQESVVETGASEESIKKSQEAARAFEAQVTEEKKKRKQNENSKDGYNY